MGAATEGGISVPYPGQFYSCGRPRSGGVAGNQVSPGIGSGWKPLPVLKFKLYIRINETVWGTGGVTGGRREVAEEIPVRSTVGLDLEGKNSSIPGR